MLITRLLNDLSHKFPVLYLLKVALLIIVVTKVFSFKVEMGDWGKLALNVARDQYKTIVAHVPIK